MTKTAIGSGSPPTAATAGAVLFGRTKREVLSRLFVWPARECYLRELVRDTGAGSGAVQRELADLVAAGLVERFRRGSHVFYRANAASPVFQELRAVLLKTVGVPSAIWSALHPLEVRGQLDLALLHGRRAPGDAPDSALHLLVVGTVSLADLLAALGSAEAASGLRLTPALHTPASYAARLAEGSPLLLAMLEQVETVIIGTLGTGVAPP